MDAFGSGVRLLRGKHVNVEYMYCGNTYIFGSSGLYMATQPIYHIIGL